MPFRRMAGFAGIFSVLLFVASFASYGSVPGTDATAAEISNYVADTGGFALAGALGALATLFMLVFFVGFSMPFKVSDREHGEGFGSLILGSAVVAVTALGAGTALFAVLSNRLDEFDDSSVWVLWDAGNMLSSFAILAFFIGGGAAAIAILRRGVMARWFGMLSGVVALAALTSLALYFGDGAIVVVLVGYLGIMVWLLTASILMVRTKA